MTACLLAMTECNKPSTQRKPGDKGTGWNTDLFFTSSLHSYRCSRSGHAVYMRYTLLSNFRSIRLKYFSYHLSPQHLRICQLLDRSMGLLRDHAQTPGLKGSRLWQSRPSFPHTGPLWFMSPSRCININIHTIQKFCSKEHGPNHMFAFAAH